MTILKIQQLQKRYGPIKALDRLDLQVEAGQVFGLLGPNGSGKTTTMGIILDVLRSDGGHYEWFGGLPPHRARRRIGALLETPNFYPYLNADDNLAIIAHIKDHSQTDFGELLRIVNLEDRRQSLFRTYSLGMKQRLAIAAALVGNPDVLVLDEPTNGLDPQGIVEVRQTILDIARSGKTILLASHMLDEVEKTCSHVAILQNGRLLAQGPVGAIIHQELTVELACTNRAGLMALLRDLDFVSQVKAEEEYLLCQTARLENVAEINRRAFAAGLVLHHLRARNNSLESEFLALTKANNAAS
ncbi:MAG: ATP-binding cassette domain-containing protein [Bacteroidota bacterium]